MSTNGPTIYACDQPKLINWSTYVQSSLPVEHHVVYAKNKRITSAN